jgi:uncharacterized protein (DUF488 family)
MATEPRIITVGVYGSSEDEFFQRLIDEQVDLFIDIRARRGLRGREYAFANSSRLQARLQALGIDYLHLKALAPTDAMRAQQAQADKADKVRKRQRTRLSAAFSEAYEREVLQPFEAALFLQALKPHHRVICLFCVERAPEACHRSLAAPYLTRLLAQARPDHA